MPPASTIVAPQIEDVSKAFAVLGFFIVVYGQVSYIAKERLYLSEPLIAITLGIIVGPYVLGWVDPLSWSEDPEIYHETTYQFTRLVVGVQVLFTGIALPKAYLRREIVSLLVLLFGIMTTAWFVTALLIWGLIRTPGEWSLTFLESLCIAAAVTPTDPVLANSITKGRYAEKHVPANVRNIILAESGANDGLGFPFLYIAVYLIDRASIDRGDSVGTEVGRWVYAVVIYQIILSCVYGFVVGFIARKTLKWAEGRQYIDKDNFFAFGLGLALFTLGTTGLFGSDDILACFVAGNSFTWDDYYRIRSEESDVQDILDMLLNAAVFIYIGTIIPWNYYHAVADLEGPTLGGIPTWRIVLLGIFVLLLRRPPWVIASTKVIPALTTFGESAFAGWFGPIGVGAVFYIEVALRSIPDDGSRERLRSLYTPVVLFTVFSSVLTHGVTIPISKLGPHVVKKTATLTRSRSITFTSRPGSRSNTLDVSSTAAAAAKEQEQDSGAQQSASSGRPKWNPLYSVGKRTQSVVLFWRPDSFWRREADHLRHGDQDGEGEGADGEKRPTISGPSDPRRRHSIEEARKAEEQGASASSAENVEAGTSESTGSSPSADAGPRGHRPVPSALELPTTSSGDPAPPVPAHLRNAGRASEVPASAASTDSQQPAPSSSATHFKWSAAGWNEELARERAEAQREAREGWPEAVRAAMGERGGEGSGSRPGTPRAGGASTPGTPNRVRFD
ncbi:hypothetical protein BDZ90DRAFT_233914 [Jaminaea rosea]|uniref:Cation/H+ exchanger transmembrane domain-containing protein n=1 Tax=Jaminaea rosea TaxID=1569628 RepID=A0A316UQQ7_9BASI|nr:hypothetical protein BDZ90DRAFT_233914 [Jaminaea rosea]PWN25455.1 hypothetical protein BDZ90DRAFT_233914 [Jaminaea rosea]